MNEPLPPVSAREPVAARIVPRSEHSISRAGISPNALKVLYRLKEAGFQAFLVGGAVRDLLLGLQPKDFDIATDARPDELRRLFRNSRLIVQLGKAEGRAVVLLIAWILRGAVAEQQLEDVHLATRTTHVFKVMSAHLEQEKEATLRPAPPFPDPRSPFLQ